MGYTSILTAFVAIFLLADRALAEDNPSSLLWYSAPASGFNSALPIGNGRIGAMIYGRIDQEIVNMNEDSIWSGGFTNRINPNAKAAFPRIRSKMDVGDLTAAGDDWLQNMTGVPTSPRRYQAACNLTIEVGHGSVQDYNRTLDVSTGLQYVKYTYNNMSFERRAVASTPANVVAFHYNGSQPGAINLTVALQRSQGNVSTTYDNGLILLRGAGTDDNMYTFTAGARVVNTGGTLTTNADSISIVNADSIVIYWDAETIYRYPNQASYESALKDRLNSAADQGFDEIYQQAVQDFQGFYSRATFSVGSSGEAVGVETYKRLQNLAASQNIDSDSELLTLMYNYGRYLLISSARPGTLSPNLQGIWNKDFDPPFGSKYTIDINLEMNSWLADINGLSESLTPLWDLLGLMRQRGQQVASDMYSASGSVCHHNTDLWGDCAPVDSGTQWTIWPMGNAWLMTHVIEHYRFTRNATFVTEVAGPLFNDAVAFYEDFCVLKDGYRTNYPSNSPENSYFIPSNDSVAGQQTGIDTTTQMDRALLWDLFTGFIELSNAVGSSNGVEDAQTFLSQLQEPIISPTTGRLLEWSQDFNETEPGHRHFSPLFGLHPGHQYSPLDNDTSIFNAANKLLQHRIDSGGGSEGWSRIWSSALFARAFNGDAAVTSAEVLLTTYTYSNLLSHTSNTFQIDANFGIVAALNEMFLQSHTDGIVHIGPALPTTRLANGSYTGWKSRGGFTVSAQWQDHHITGATISASVDGPLKVRIEGGRAFRVDGQSYGGAIQATAGSTYVVTF
ncbi:glycoside hydrolase family 95 protein [Zasmidium cellare ATCC 36951]|uniref:Glycoside hydrolase family 95 protein n=1 Tax=Zasmidium cellare ATCC 36951 TaxID=1080233 RepID=A0A6A6CK55_ZASCE|nr:glycoside hydrolase family 95 protein [Zasmidium cellare ATCC 36951]KAF2167617.1 glycoside hydrolase family 95 protein [Zasmidium cellare ATCC 36951]